MQATSSQPVAEAVVSSNDFARRRARPSRPWATSTRQAWRMGVRWHGEPTAPGGHRSGDGLSFTDTTPRGRPPAVFRVDSRGSGPIGRNTVSEILLSVLAEALGAVLLGLVLTAIRRAMGAAPA